MDEAAKEFAKPGKADLVNNALMPPLAVSMPKVDNKLPETRFDLAVNNTPANQVFTAIVSGTRYSMLVPPDIKGDITLNLKDVTVFDALEAIRELYGFEYTIDGSRIYIRSAALQTRIFQVNYLTGERVGQSSVTVKSSDSVAGGKDKGASGQNEKSSSIITKSSSKDFWTELDESIKSILGGEKGRSVKINPMSGVIVVRAMPEELRSVAAYLKASQLSIERQVILEAKIIEVQLNDSYQSGVNWSAFGSLNNNPTKYGSFGVLSSGASLAPIATDGTAQSISNSVLSAIPSVSMSSAAVAGTMFGLAFQTNNFAALLNFLESQGDVHVLSSPRIATLNNQKAVLKVGTDEYFATGFTTVAGQTNGTVITPATVTPEYSLFFSGIALDVTPRIDENGEVILHVHPSVSSVGTVNKQAIIGSGTTGVVPLASSTISETDSIVRAHDGQIVVIGGLINQQTSTDESGLPGMPKSVFGQTSKVTKKRELVILLKPTVVDVDSDWSDDIARSKNRMNSLSR
jgi:MSHA biogenesis protein MshL